MLVIPRTVVAVSHGTHHHHTAHSHTPSALASTAHHTPTHPFQHTQDYIRGNVPEGDRLN